MKILITAGPTREPIDPVRFITNRSSGKMGYELAAEFSRLGHSVLLISGPCSIPIPDGVDFLPVETAAEMYQAVEDYISTRQVAIFAAAVADYTVASVASQKIKKSADSYSLNLVKTKDILGSARSQFQFKGTLVGFAAETENLIDNAQTKLTKKQCDLIVANDVSQPGIGFDSDHNEVILVYPDRIAPLPMASKHELAHQIAHHILQLTPSHS